MTTEFEIKKGIAELTDKNALVLFYKCREYTHDAIIPLLSGDRESEVSREAVQKHVTIIYDIFFPPKKTVEDENGEEDKEEVKDLTREGKQDALLNDVCPIFRQYVNDSNDLNNWYEIRAQLKDELRELEELEKTEEPIKIGDDSVFVPPIDEPNFTERLRRTAEDLQDRLGIQQQRTFRIVGILGGVIVILIVVILVLLIQRACQPQAIPPAPATRVPTSIPTSTQVEQVFPPPETAVPIPPTVTPTPTITLTPTNTPTPTSSPTPTITPTPTIAPTIVGLENLPLTFTGTYDEDVYWPEPMMIKIESKNGDAASGTFLFTDRGRVTGWEGNVVYNFDESAELARWLFVEGFDTDGIYIKVSNTWEIAGGGVGGSGDRYYFHISTTGIISGVRYRTLNRTTPSAIINLTLSE